MNTRSAPRTSSRKSCTNATLGDEERTGMLRPSVCIYGPRMWIFVDGRHAGAGRGVARYTDEILRRMRALGGDWEVVDQGRARNAVGALVGRPRLGVGADVVWLPAPAPVAVG